LNSVPTLIYAGAFIVCRTIFALITMKNAMLCCFSLDEWFDIGPYSTIFLSPVLRAKIANFCHLRGRGAPAAPLAGYRT